MDTLVDNSGVVRHSQARQERLAPANGGRGVALLVLLYLPLRSGEGAAWNFGNPSDFRSFVWFIRVCSIPIARSINSVSGPNT